MGLSLEQKLEWVRASVASEGAETADEDRAEMLEDVGALLAIAADVLAGRRVRPDRFNALRVDGLQLVTS